MIQKVPRSLQTARAVPKDRSVSPFRTNGSADQPQGTLLAENRSGRCGTLWHIEGAKSLSSCDTPPVIRTGAHAWAWRLRPIHGSHGFRLLGDDKLTRLRSFLSRGPPSRFPRPELLRGFPLRGLRQVLPPDLRFRFLPCSFRFYVFGAFDPAPFGISRLG